MQLSRPWWKGHQVLCSVWTWQPTLGHGIQDIAVVGNSIDVALQCLEVEELLALFVNSMVSCSRVSSVMVWAGQVERDVRAAWESRKWLARCLAYSFSLEMRLVSGRTSCARWVGANPDSVSWKTLCRKNLTANLRFARWYFHGPARTVNLGGTQGIPWRVRYFADGMHLLWLQTTTTAGCGWLPLDRWLQCGMIHYSCAWSEHRWAAGWKCGLRGRGRCRVQVLVSRWWAGSRP